MISSDPLSYASVFLAHLSVTAPDGTTSELYVSDTPIRPLRPNDSVDPNRLYNPVLIEPANLRRALFGDITRGGGESGYGLMKLSNVDRMLSSYRNYKFGTLQILRYVPESDLASAVPVFCGRVSRPDWVYAGQSQASLTLNLRDAFFVVEGSVQTDRYAGEAESGDILSGPEGLQDALLPRSFGNLSQGHVGGVLVSPADQIWQLHDGPLAAITEIYDRGDSAGYTSDGDLSEAAFLAATPAADRYVTHLAKGLVKLGGSPVGEVGFSFVQEAGLTPRALIKTLLLEAGVSAGSIGGSFEGSEGPVIGISLDQDYSRVDLIRSLARAEFAAVLPDRAGVWQYLPFAGLDPEVSHSLGPDDILDLSPDGEPLAPAMRVRVGFGQKHKTISRGNMAPAILGTEAESKVSTRWRFAVAETPSGGSTETDGRDIEILTPLQLRADAQALADLGLMIFGRRESGGLRETLRLVVSMTDDRLAVDLGDTVHVFYPDGEIDRDYILVGIEPTRPKLNQMIWKVWG